MPGVTGRPRHFGAQNRASGCARPDGHEVDRTARLPASMGGRRVRRHGRGCAPSDAEGGTASGANSLTRTRLTGTVLGIHTMPMTSGGFVRTYSGIMARRGAAEDAMRTSETRHRLLTRTTRAGSPSRQAGRPAACVSRSPTPLTASPGRRFPTCPSASPEPTDRRPADSGARALASRSASVWSR